MIVLAVIQVVLVKAATTDYQLTVAVDQQLENRLAKQLCLGD